MNYPFNEPIKVAYNIRPKTLSVLNRIPYKDYIFWVFRKKFAKISGFIDESISMNARIVEHPMILKNIDIEGGRILDIGCCESKLPIELASIGYEVYGLDQREYSLKHPNFKFVQGDATSLPFSDAFFDIVVSVSTIEHIGHGVYGDPLYEKGDRRALLEMWRVTKPGGSVLLTMPYGGKPLPEDSFWYNKIHWYNPEAIKRLTEGLNVEKEAFYSKKEGCWVPCSSYEAANLDPDSCVAFLKLTKPTSELERGTSY